jgi:hypothetical protein
MYLYLALSSMLAILWTCTILFKIKSLVDFFNYIKVIFLYILVKYGKMPYLKFHKIYTIKPITNNQIIILYLLHILHIIQLI